MTTDDEDCLFNSFARYQSALISSPRCSIHHGAKNRYPVHGEKSTEGRQKWKHYYEVRVSTAAVKNRWHERKADRGRRSAGAGLHTKASRDPEARRVRQAGHVTGLFGLCGWSGFPPMEPERQDLRGAPQVLKPMRRDFGPGSVMSSRMASKMTRNWASYFFSNSASLRASALFDPIISRRRTKARMMPMLT